MNDDSREDTVLALDADELLKELPKNSVKRLAWYMKAIPTRNCGTAWEEDQTVVPSYGGRVFLSFRNTRMKNWRIGS
jgi:hypothetical protein